MKKTLLPALGFRRGLGRLLSAAACVWFLVGGSGCEKDPPAKTEKTEQTDSAAKATATSSDLHSAELTKSAIDMLQPDRLGITSQADTAVSILNQWLSGRNERPAETYVVPPEARKLIEPVLTPDEMPLITTPRFSVANVLHIRNSLLAKAIVGYALNQATTDVERATALFDYVVRNIELVPDDDSALPMTPYHIMMTGKGTASDRAWMFAELLRQLQIDAVILTPRKSAEAAEPKRPTPAESSVTAGDRSLVGVLLDDQVYLFDPSLGWPIPSPQDDASSLAVERPGTLSDVLADDSLLRRLDLTADDPYPLKSDDLKSVRVELVGTASHWVPWMQSLEQSISGEQSVVVYDGLADVSDQAGLVSRVARGGVGLWIPGDIAVWPYPQRRLREYENLTDRQQQRLNVLRQVLSAYQEVTVQQKIENGQPVFLNDQPVPELKIAPPTYTQLKTRNSHLLGDFAPAIRSYINVRVKSQFDPNWPVPPEIRLTHARAAEDAFCWMGLCQFEQQEFARAIETFRSYLKRYQLGIAFVAHPSNDVASLKLDDLYPIYSRQITSWRSLGSELGDSINLIGLKGNGPVESMFLMDVLRGEDQLNRSRVRDKETTPEVLDAVASDPQSLGFVSLAELDPDDKRVKVLGIVLPGETSAETVTDGVSPRYPLMHHGSWVESARYLEALALARTDKLAEAVEVLEDMPADRPQSDGYRLLVRRWREQLEADKAQAGKPN